MKDPRAEQLVDSERVDWHTEKDIPLSRVDWEASLKNQARLGQALIQEHIDKLCDNILDGVQLPDPIGYYNKNGRIVIISGNHRVAAYKQINELKLGNIEKIDWYIVNTDPWRIDVLTRISNVIESQIPMKKEDKVEHAKHFVRVLNYSIIDAAKKLGISNETVARALQSDDVRERLAKYKFKEDIPFSTLHRLYRIKQDNALLKTAELVKEAQLSGDEATEVARKVEKAAASEKQQLYVLEQLRHNYKGRIARTKRGESKHQLTPTIKLSRGANYINSTRPEAVAPLEPELRRNLRSAMKKAKEIDEFGQSS